MSKTLKEFLDTLPEDVRQKVVGVDTAAGAHNQNSVNELFDTNLDAILNMAVLATQGSTTDADRQFVERGLSLVTTTVSVARAIMTQLIPAGGPREQMHQIFIKGVSIELPKFEAKLVKILADAIAHRAVSGAEVTAEEVKSATDAALDRLDEFNNLEEIGR